MKIAIASSGLGYVVRGIEIWAQALAEALAARHLDVLLYKGGGVADSPIERVIGSWSRHSKATRRLLRMMPRRFFWRLGLASPHGVEQFTFLRGLLLALRRDSIDILHVQDPLIAFYVQYARRLRIVKTRVILGHGTMETLAFLRKIEYVQHLAPWHLQEARDAGVLNRFWRAIPNFVETERFCPGESTEIRAELGIPSNAIVVMTSAAIDKRVKRIDYLIDEFCTLLKRCPDLPLWLLVAGGREADTDEIIRNGRERLGDRVRFLVSVPGNKMPSIYRAADVFALCSLKEMMPIALLEAAATGLPCLVHRHPVLEWAAGPGAKVVDMAAPGALSDALASLLTDPNASGTLGKKAREYCIANFGQDRVVDQIRDYYRFVLTHNEIAAHR